MKSAILIAMFSWLLVTASAAQESSESESTDAATETEASEVDESLQEDDELLDLNTDHTDADDDVFVPSDEVSYQQSVPFPTDI